MPSESIRPAFISPDTREGRYLFLDLDPPRGPGLTLVGAGWERCTPEYRIDRPGFDYHTIEFVAGGNWELDRGEGPELLRPGALFSYGPGLGFSLVTAGGGEWIKYFVNFTGDAAARWLADCGLADGGVLYTRQARWIHDLFDQLIDCSRLDPEEAGGMAGRLGELLLLRIRSDAWKEGQRQSDRRQTYARCRAYIQEHFLELNSVAEVARGCHVDPAYLARLFRRFANERPLQFLTRLKTQHAADLIMRAGYRVGQAGAAVGFSDPYHFSRVFKRVHGIPPGRIAGLETR